MRHVRDRQLGRVQILLDLLDLLLQGRHTLAQRSAFGDELLLDGGVLFLGDCLRHLVGTLLLDLGLAEQAFALVVEGDNTIDVGLDAAVDAVVLDGLQIVANEGGIQHGKLDGCEEETPTDRPRVPRAVVRVGCPSDPFSVWFIVVDTGRGGDVRSQRFLR